MKTMKMLVAAVAAFTLVVAAQAAPGNGKGGAKGRPRKALVHLTNSGFDADAKGKLDLKHFGRVGSRNERSWFRLRCRHLEPAATYQLWMDDPATPDDGDDLTTDDHLLVYLDTVSLVANGDGAFNVRLDSKKGALMPFGAALPDLAGLALEIRAADGTTVVLSGAVPAVQ